MINKKYFLIEEIPPQKSSKKSLIYHHNFQSYSGQLELDIETVSPIHIGTGNAEVDNSGIYWTFPRVRNLPVIPGSSLKGTVRGIFEALSPSCSHYHTKEDKCNPKGEYFCPACRVFGTMGYQSRVLFGDAFFRGSVSQFREIINIEERWSPQRSYPGYRKFYFHYSSIKEGNERVEAIRKGARFIAIVNFFNLEDWELGLLLLSLGVSPQHGFNLKIGGGKAQGLGSIRILARGKYGKDSDSHERSFTNIDSNIEYFVKKYFEWITSFGIKADDILNTIDKFNIVIDTND